MAGGLRIFPANKYRLMDDVNKKVKCRFDTYFTIALIPQHYNLTLFISS